MRRNNNFEGRNSFGAFRSRNNFRDPFRNNSRVRNNFRRKNFEIRNNYSLTDERSTEIHGTILSCSTNIADLQANNTLVNFLNSTSSLDKCEVYALISSFNTFKINQRNNQSTRDIFLSALESDFISNTLQTIIQDYFLESPNIEEIKVMILFLRNCLELFPVEFVMKMALLCPGVQVASQQFNDSEVKELMKILNNSLKKAKDNFKEGMNAIKTVSKLDDYEVNDFRKFSVFPQSSDIFCLNNEVKIRRNKIRKPNKNEDFKYKSVDDYLDTQFCLMKEDFVRPLREGIATLRINMYTSSKSEKQKVNLKYLENTVIEELYTSQVGLVYKVMFDVTKLKRIDWKKTKRFIYGSLLCFTKNSFDTLYFASVVESDPKKLERGILVVQFNDDPIKEMMENNNFLMIETKNLFEAYKHVLHKLQNFSTESLPFQEYLVFGENNHQSPSYMNKKDLSLIDKIGDLDEQFDESQRMAFKNALKSKLSLIQGPPGTGKTYVGLKIINFLENNFQTDHLNIGPILVVCYTNHALDQFLCDIINEIGIENVLRVGGRSKLDIMKDCNMTTLKWKWIRKKSFPHNLYKRSIQIKKEIEFATENVIKKYVKIKNCNKTLLSLNDLKDCMSYNHLRYFQTNNFDTWIKGGDSMLKNINEKDSNLKQTLIEDICKIEIYHIVHNMSLEIITNIMKDANVIKIEEEDVIVEDPDDILFDQRFLAEDINLLQHGNQYQYLYDEIDRKDNEEVSDENEFKCVANVKLIKSKLKTVKPIAEEDCNKLESLDVDFSVRLQLYKFWLEKYQIIQFEEYKNEKCKFDIINKDKEEILFEEYIEIMQSMKVIGMTTSGAARYGAALDKVGCRVVIIEEAAEVLESHVVCSLSKHCEQLIMIGDHKQLRPKVEVYELETNYDFGISLFERLIANECQYFTLKYQHRMRPEISTCVKPIYPDLKDSDNVLEYSSVEGMKTDIYFFNHYELENMSNETSYKNDFEAEFIAKLCEYLIQNGNLPCHITVLTLYSGQLYNISNRMRLPMFKGIRICVVDNFQGEENEIIILSLVRSNYNDVVGFVKSENRLCVAISRAKRGFYAIGNFTMLRSKIDLLNNIIENHLNDESFGGELPLRCLMHPREKKYTVSTLQDFSKLGCPSICNFKLPCNHLCVDVCHRKKPSHAKYKCKMNCGKLCTRQLHKCKLLCYQQCTCLEYITITLHCSHEANISCFETKIICNEICEKKLNCDHTCVRLCHEICKCEAKIKSILGCAHETEVVCGTDMSIVKCLQICNKKLACEHICRKKCYETCKCHEIIQFQLPCLHITKLLCGTDIVKFRCKIKMERNFDCGHLNVFECFQKVEYCTTEVKKKLDCEHNITVYCGKKTKDYICDFVCGMKLGCNHKCQGKCGECYKKQLHKACTKICLKLLNCGHTCNKSCHSGFCPPCKEKCDGFCEHSQCDSICGELCKCISCERNCTKDIICERCEKTDNCSQLCGEDCSTLCKVHSRMKFKNIQEYYVMNPCSCYIYKQNFQPEIRNWKNQCFLHCQTCHAALSTPYKGVVFLYYKKIYLTLFETLNNDQNLKWTKLFTDFKEINYFTINFEELISKIEITKIHKDDLNQLDISYTFKQDLLDICNKMVKIRENQENKYQKDLKSSLRHIIEWLNPFSRSLTHKEIYFLNFEIPKLSFSCDLLSYLNIISAAEYALLRKDFLDILEELKNELTAIEFNKLREKTEKIKANLKNIRNSTEKEEELVEKIISAKDIYKEFKIDNLSVEEKLKEIKKLILKCHPDKNQSLRAHEAVKILLEKKKLLE